MIWLRLHLDPKTGKEFRGIYQNGVQVEACWEHEDALAFAEGLADLTGDKIWSAPILTFPKRGAA